MNAIKYFDKIGWIDLNHVIIVSEIVQELNFHGSGSYYEFYITLAFQDKSRTVQSEWVEHELGFHGPEFESLKSIHVSLLSAWKEAKNERQQ